MHKHKKKDQFLWPFMLCSRELSLFFGAFSNDDDDDNEDSLDSMGMSMLQHHGLCDFKKEKRKKKVNLSRVQGLNKSDY